MKYIVPVILVLCLLMMTGCTLHPDGTPAVTDTPSVNATPLSTPTPTIGPEPAVQQIEYMAQYIRKGSGVDGEEYPSTQMIRTLDAMSAYDTTLGYDEAFFKTHVLLVVRLMESSGSVSHNVASVASTGNALSVSIVRLRPEIGTDDMAAWHILIELPASVPDDVKLDLSEVSMSHKEEIKRTDDAKKPGDKKKES